MVRNCSQKISILSSCSLFFHRRSFFTCWLLAFLIFSLPLQNFHPSSSEIRLRGFFFSRLLFLCYPCHCRHQNLVEKMTRLVDVFFFLNVQVAMRFTAKTSGCLNAKSHSGLHVGVFRTDAGHVIAKISRIYRLPVFLTHDALLRALLERSTMQI